MKAEEVCYLYLMEDLCYGGVKIGISNNPSERRKAVQIEYETKIAIRYIVECENRTAAFKLEKRLHRKFAENRQEGEWFYIPVDLILLECKRLKFHAVDLKTDVNYRDPPRSKPKSRYQKPRRMMSKLAFLRPSNLPSNLQIEVMRLQIQMIRLEQRLIFLELKQIRNEMDRRKKDVSED